MNSTNDISLKLVKISFYSYFVLTNTSVDMLINPLSFVADRMHTDRIFPSELVLHLNIQ